MLLCLVTNTNKGNTETKVKKAMIYIMSNKSVIFTKTDLTHICGNSAVRSNAVDRLIAAGLLQHGKNYWVEPSRAKKNSKKEQKQNFREGWIKYVSFRKIVSFNVRLFQEKVQNRLHLQQFSIS